MVWLDKLAKWIANSKTLLDALDLVDPTVLPVSFERDILSPVSADKDCLNKLASDHASLNLLLRLSELALEASDRTWFFWDKAALELCRYCGAEVCILYRRGDRGVLHKIHPLVSEEDLENLAWPPDILDPITPKLMPGFGQGFLVGLGLKMTHPLVAHFLCKSVVQRLALEPLNDLAAMGNLIYSISSTHFPNMDLSQSMVIVGNDDFQFEQGTILGRDPGFLMALAAVRQASNSVAPVYLKGESGTGKELFARYLHNHSELKNGRFVPINCSAIPQDLIESEMFGHEKGAFTGAYYRKIGKAEQAHEGTLFLDEIGEMPLPFQAKLLRYLQEKQFTRVGGTQLVLSHARIVVATHRDLKDMVAAGSFRDDLYYRVNVIPITIAPLRDRGGDIRFLAEKFFRKYISKSRMSRRQVDESVFDILTGYAYPGNVRELDNIIQRTVVMTQKAVISAEDLPDEILELEDYKPKYLHHAFEKFDHLVPRDRETLRWLKKEAEVVSSSYLRDLERRFLLQLLGANDGSVRKAANAASINRTLFYKLLKKAGLDITILQKSEM